MTLSDRNSDLIGRTRKLTEEMAELMLELKPSTKRFDDLAEKTPEQVSNDAAAYRYETVEQLNAFVDWFSKEALRLLEEYKSLGLEPEDPDETRESIHDPHVPNRAHQVIVDLSYLAEKLDLRSIGASNAGLLDRTRAVMQEYDVFMEARDLVELPIDASTCEASSEGRSYESAEMTVGFLARFGGSALALFEAYKERGLVPSRERASTFSARHPTNRIGISFVMGALAELADKLEGKPPSPAPFTAPGDSPEQRDR